MIPTGAIAVVRYDHAQAQVELAEAGQSLLTLPLEAEPQSPSNTWAPPLRSTSVENVGAPAYEP
ncbi:hypothetical protein D3C78_1880680 [compost metagenome]